MPDLWSSSDTTQWQRALARYDAVVEAQGVRSLGELDAWYRETLPAAIADRDPRSVTVAELARLTEWKMARGVWRARNLALVRGNDPDDVRSASAAAFDAVPHPTRPIAALAKLAGVGPATASGVLAAAEPGMYPFFDELVAGQIPTLGPVKWTVGYYATYAAALRDRADALGNGWTPVRLERALWAHAGGKAGARG